MGDHIILRQLNNLPKFLDETYDRILNDLDTFERQEAERLLSLICFAKRPLPLFAITDALAIDFQDPGEGPFDPSFRVKDPMAALDYCPGLITLQRHRGINAPRERYGPVVALSHFSVEQYLRPSISSWRFGACSNAHALFARTCLRFLLYFDLPPDVRVKTILQRFPFLHYAVENFAYHLKLSANDTQVLDLLYRLLANEHALKICYTVSAPLISSREVDFSARERRKRDLGFTAPVPSALFLATLWDLPAPVIRRLLEDTSVASLNQVFEVGDEIELGLPRTPIEAAAYKGNYEVFVMLHESGAFFGDSLWVVDSFFHPHRHYLPSKSAEVMQEELAIIGRIIRYVVSHEEGE